MTEINKPVQNKLLIKNEIGKCKQPTFFLPPITHTYGKAPTKDPEGAREVTTLWKYHDETKDKQPPRDFLRLNKDCLRERHVSAKEISNYRQAHQDVLKKIKKGKQTIEVNVPDEEFVFGIRNRPSTPIDQVVQLQYLKDHERKLINHYANKNEQKKSKIQIKGTQAQQLRLEMQKQMERESQGASIDEFKLGRFKNIKPKVFSRQLNQSLDEQKNSSVLESEAV